MTPEERQERIKALEAELEELKKAGSSARRFWELMSGTEVKADFDKYPRTLFGFRDSECVWKFDFKDNCLWLRYSTVWSVLETEYNLDYNDVQALVRSEVEKHFNCRRVAISACAVFSLSQVEEHFKCRGTVDQFWSKNLC
jgi:hypothetical protein